MNRVARFKLRIEVFLISQSLSYNSKIIIHNSGLSTMKYKIKNVITIFILQFSLFYIFYKFTSCNPVFS